MEVKKLNRQEAVLSFWTASLLKYMSRPEITIHKNNRYGRTNKLCKTKSPGWLERPARDDGPE
ncbi:hypothetical protein IQ05_00875 [Flavobacterium tiangeerense]|uniref:Uncharacterized protein n=1 Tax=Flavobacterium tiangeerense TaxID=459471 RepID=A0ABY3FLJ2_9FLAO|nr:hypothetical protein IQ05_00875 [Flavobacterium tiangeerense]